MHIFAVDHIRINFKRRKWRYRFRWWVCFKFNSNTGVWIRYKAYRIKHQLFRSSTKCCSHNDLMRIAQSDVIAFWRIADKACLEFVAVKVVPAYIDGFFVQNTERYSQPIQINGFAISNFLGFCKREGQ